MVITINTLATGGWGFHFDVTKQQARDILSASEGDVIKLNGKNEILSIGTHEMGHSRSIGTGSTSEELVASDVRKQLKKLKL